ncbi:hypothetical protein NP284_04250, partial [Rhodopseudomonas pseudopalustris]|uniref:hypothetical protein n=1 Tax=Rhodopseudomonas pseudopalustris TaxID=1513892 RepID=UPI003F9BBE6E
MTTKTLLVAAGVSTAWVVIPAKAGIPYPRDLVADRLRSGILGRPLSRAMTAEWGRRVNTEATPQNESVQLERVT